MDSREEDVVYHFEFPTAWSIIGKTINFFEVMILSIANGMGFIIGAAISIWVIIRIFFRKK